MTQEINFQIRGIETIEFSLKEKQQIPADSVFGFNFQLEHSLHIEDNVNAVVCTLSVVNHNGESSYGKLKVACIYTVENMDDFISSDKKLVTFPEGFEITLNSITLSTVRGIAYAMFKGTYLHNAILPIVDPKGLATKPTTEAK